MYIMETEYWKLKLKSMICNSIRKMTYQDKIDKIYKTFVHTVNYKELMSEIKDLNKWEDILKDYCAYASGDSLLRC